MVYDNPHITGYSPRTYIYPKQPRALVSLFKWLENFHFSSRRKGDCFAFPKSLMNLRTFVFWFQLGFFHLPFQTRGFTTIAPHQFCVVFDKKSGFQKFTCWKPRSFSGPSVGSMSFLFGAPPAPARSLFFPNPAGEWNPFLTRAKITCSI